MSDDEFRQMMAEARAEFRASLPARINAIDAMWARLCAAPPASAPMDELLLAVHRIAGSAETFGEAAVGQAAAAAEAALEACRAAGNPDNARGRASCAGLIADLRQAVDEALRH